MSGVIFRSEPPARGVATALAPVRVRGGIAAHFVSDSGRTTVASLSERGGYRLARPSTFAPHLEALQVNTGGGVVGGDRVAFDFAVGAGADVVVSTSSAERIYRSDGATAELGVKLSLEAGARLDWLPQQTIVVAGARVRRRIEVDVAAGSQFVMAEMLTFGRPASEETRSPAAIADHWRVRRDGRLVFAEALALDGAYADVLARPAVANGARASALILCVAPDAPDRLDRVRLALEGAPCDAAASTWNGLLVVRALAARPQQLIAGVTRAIEALTGRLLPRVWSI